MKNEQSRIREAVRRIDVAEEWLVNNAFPPEDHLTTYRLWQQAVRAYRRSREDAIIELIDACRKYLKPGG